MPRRIEEAERDEVTGRVFYLDALRVLASMGVVIVHALGPFRDRIGEIPDWQWATAISLNVGNRWPVPVFIMITGSLLLSDRRPFDPAYYARRRLLKVLLPFVAWSVLYGVFAGVSLEGFSSARSVETLTQASSSPTYYHLAFFYYFIPLYFVAPVLRRFVHDAPALFHQALLLVWLIATAAYLFYLKGPWDNQYFLFSGFLLLGFTLHRLPVVPLAPVCLVALLALGWTETSLLDASFEAERYRYGRWLSYKTLNTVVVASAVFLLCKQLAERMPVRWRMAVVETAPHSLGIYLLHPIFLWPAREIGTFFENPVIAIPIWTVFAWTMAFLTSRRLSRSPATRWLVP